MRVLVGREHLARPRPLSANSCSDLRQTPSKAMRSARRVRSVAPEQAWELVAGRHARLLDLRTEGEPPPPRIAARRPPGLACSAHRLARRTGHDLSLPAFMSLEAHRAARRGAVEVEVAGGRPDWREVGLAIDHTRPG